MHRRAIITDKDSSGRRPGKSGRLPSPRFRFRSGPSIAVFSCILVVGIMSVIFGKVYEISFWIILCSLPVAVLPGIAAYYFDRFMIALYRKFTGRHGRLQAGFMSFFLCLLGGIFLFSLFLALPMKLVFGWFGTPGVAQHYGRWAVNLGIGGALLCWARCLVEQRFVQE